MNDDDHTCFGCGKAIGDGQPHIHLPLDEWSQREGLSALGLGDDDFLLPFCEPCTVDSDRGWQLEAHTIQPKPEGRPERVYDTLPFEPVHPTWGYGWPQEPTEKVDPP